MLNRIVKLQYIQPKKYYKAIKNVFGTPKYFVKWRNTQMLI